MEQNYIIRTTIQHIIIIIIIIDFYGAYILRNLSSEARQNRISKRNRKQGRAKVNIRTRDNRTFMVGMQVRIDMSWVCFIVIESHSFGKQLLSGGAISNLFEQYRDGHAVGEGGGIYARWGMSAHLFIDQTA